LPANARPGFRIWFDATPIRAIAHLEVSKMRRSGRAIMGYFFAKKELKSEQKGNRGGVGSMQILTQTAESKWFEWVFMCI
jgi:hypothetical protein